MRSVFLALVVLFSSAGEPIPEIPFEDVTMSSGLLKPLAGMMGHAAAWGDLDKDGLPDLFVAGFCDRPSTDYAPAKGPVTPKLFRNLGSGKFQLINNKQIEFCGRSTGATFADLNNDRFPELLVSNNSVPPSAELTETQRKAQSQRSKLFQNRKGELIDVTEKSGAFAEEIPRIRSMAVLDFNNDRLPDLLLLQDKFRDVKIEPSSALLKNTGNLKFKNVTSEAGLPADLFGLGIAVADLNDDSRPDFFVSHSNRLFLSTSKDRYREAPELAHIFHWTPLDAEDWPCGSAFGDLNRDGRLDLVVTAHHDPARNRVYINRGNKNGVPAFEDVTTAVGLSENVPAKSPHVEIQDFNNDGWMDIYISAAWKTNQGITPVIYRNRGVQKNGLPLFESERSMKPPMIYFPSGPASDFNLDGKMDLLLVNWFSGETSHLLMNQSRTGNWLQIKAPLGAKIQLTSRGKIIGYQQIYTGYGFASGQEPVCHFGVGALRNVDIEVILPNGTIKRSQNSAVNRRMEFE
jgi:enediyne biosynthesis protein E4